MHRLPTCALLLAGAALLAAPAVSVARDDDDDDRGEITTAGTCSTSARAELKLKTDDGGIEAEFEVDGVAAGSRWRVVLAQDGRVVARTTATATARSGSFSVERHLRDRAGADRISARATGPGGASCRATARMRAS